jgi:hypothetical protein
LLFSSSFDPVGFAIFATPERRFPAAVGTIDGTRDPLKD